MTPAGFPHSDTPGSQLGCQLPRAYRRLLRPSSALDAKASTMCPYSLSYNHNRCYKDVHCAVLKLRAVTTAPRCSRPLCRSQQRTRQRPRSRSQEADGPEEIEQHSIPQDPTVCQTSSSPRLPRGSTPAAPTGSRSSTDERLRTRAGQIVDDSTSEHRLPRTHVHEQTDGQPARWRAAKCSLERR